ncbi:hypothetical protein NQ315_006807 [Exocentrus adspersus]|uniref:Uncharacterized protein n=1 Tax=Exocentrus adspersus TaxID=1586481 RepID=A0AAV8WCU7_9CUCU|nr:hypothetical protein NQ315_006807 [Exocentrus adspersus]
MSKYYYLDVSLDFAEPYETEITGVYFKKNIVSAVNQLFGEVAAAVNIDILKYNSANRRAVLRVPKTHYIKLRSSLTLCGKFEGHPCAYTVHKATPLLLALQGDSRDYTY